jgi:hypothetical protein
LPKGDFPFRYLRTRPSPDNIRVKIRAASAKLASRVQDISRRNKLVMYSLYLLANVSQPIKWSVEKV